MHDTATDATVLAGRLLLAALFVAGAAQKLIDPTPVLELLAGRGLAGMFFWPALAINAVGALALIVGIRTRAAAAGLAFYCGVTSIFHWIPDDPWQISIFVKNWAIAGGLLILAAHGPGRFALRP